jgi:membrane-bound lytic murein transglycosylase A
LGVPLTATRSIAVDPRSTPLGAPVFIEAERDGSAEPLRRLMIAQDTGGAIRGAVRADFFWGTGPTAGAQALRTKDDLAMWVLLPRNFRPASASTRTRNIGGASPTAAGDCVMPDAEYCLE